MKKNIKEKITTIIVYAVAVLAVPALIYMLVTRPVTTIPVMILLGVPATYKVVKAYKEYKSRKK